MMLCMIIVPFYGRCLDVDRLQGSEEVEADFIGTLTVIYVEKRTSHNAALLESRFRQLNEIL